MILFILATIGQCGVQTCVNRIVHHRAIVTTPYVAHVAHVDHHKPYFAYKVPDPEVERLQRQNEKLQEALIEELRERRKEVQKLQSERTPANAPASKTSEEANDFTPETILRVACGKCHMNGKTKGDFGISFPLDNEAKAQIADVLRRGTMPPPGEPKLTEEARETLSLFLALGINDEKAKSKGKTK